MQDKEQVLYDCGRELFATKGFKDTGVADITQKAGFSVGTFYNYFSSKDKLFAEIFKRETAELTKAIMRTLDLEEEPAILIRRLMTLNMEGMQKNPILRQWYQPDVFAKIEKVYREEDGLQAVDFLYHDFFKLVEAWKRNGKMRADISTEMIMAIFQAIIQIGHHKEEIGLQYFPELQERMTELILRGLTGTINGSIKVGCQYKMDDFKN